MKVIAGTFNNREIAVGIWMIVVFVYLIITIGKQPFTTLLKAVLVKQISILMVVMFLYISSLISIFSRIGIWNVADLKDTLYWSLGVALVMLINLNQIAQTEGYIKKIILDTIKLIAILEFVVNFYVFDLWVEILLQPVIVLIFMLKTVSDSDLSYKKVGKLMEYFLGIIGIGVLIFAFTSLFSGFQEFMATETLRSFLLTPVLTVGFLPFVLLLALYSEYTQILTRLKMAKNDSRIIRIAMLKIFLAFHLNIRALHLWSKRARPFKITNKDEIADLIGR